MAFRHTWVRALAGALALAATLGACNEELDSGAACATLCPGTELETREVSLDAITLEATVPAVLETGAEPDLEGIAFGIPLIDRKDTLQTRLVIHFDTLFARYTAGTDTVTSPITAVTRSGVTLRFDSTRSTIQDSVTIRAWDIDDGSNDTTTAGIEAKLVPSRLVSTVTVAKPGLLDSIFVPLSSEFVVGKLQATGTGKRIRLAFSVTSPRSAVIRVIPTLAGGASGPRLRYLAPDTTDKFDIPARSGEASVDLETATRRADFFTLPVRPPVRTDAVLAVGGLPARRVVLRFAIPDSIRAAAAIVRAELRLVQADDPLAPLVDTARVDTTASGRRQRIDTVTVLPLIGIGAEIAASDPVRAGQLARRTLTATGFSIGALQVLPRVPAGDSAIRTIDLGGMIRRWNNLDEDEPRYIVLASRYEAAQAATFYFYSNAAPDPAVRPRLFIRYIPRVGYGLP